MTGCSPICSVQHRFRRYSPVASALDTTREAFGLAWGKATTVALAVGVAVMAVPLPPNLEVPAALRWALFGVAVVVAVLRQVAPPPPAVTIKRDDAVDVNHVTGIVTITKAEGLPADMRSKAAGAAPREPPPPQN